MNYKKIYLLGLVALFTQLGANQYQPYLQNTSYCPEGENCVGNGNSFTKSGINRGPWQHHGYSDEWLGQQDPTFPDISEQPFISGFERSVYDSPK